MPSLLSLRAVDALLSLGCEIAWMVQPLARQRRRDPALTPIEVDRGPIDPARLVLPRGVPCLRVGDASAPPALGLYRDHPVDLVLIAFFNQLLRPAALDVLGPVVNLHPSLLPELRGPAPLFWTYARGLEETGLTLHRVTPGEDDGPVLYQARLPVRLGEPAEGLIDRLGHLAPAAVSALLQDPTAPGAPQSGAPSRAPRPRSVDRRVDHARSARALFHLVRGAGRLAELVVDDGADGVRVIDAHRFIEGTPPPVSLAVNMREAVVAAADGFVVCQLA